MLVVTRLCGGQGACGAEAEPLVGITLQGGEVIQQVWCFGAGPRLHRCDDALRAGGESGDLIRSGSRNDAVLVGLAVVVGEQQVAVRAFDVVPHARKWRVGTGERDIHLPVLLRHERADFDVAVHDHCQCRRLYAAERQHTADRSGTRGGRAGPVHSHQPVSLAACPRGGFEGLHLRVRTQRFEGILDGRLGHRREPGPLHDLSLRLGRGALKDELEDELALTSGVAGIDDDVHVGPGHESVKRSELLGRSAIAGLVAELLGDDRQVLVCPLLVPGVVGVGIHLLKQMPHCI